MTQVTTGRVVHLYHTAFAQLQSMHVYSVVIIIDTMSSVAFVYCGRYLVTFSPLADNPDDPQVLLNVLIIEMILPFNLN